MVDAEGAAAEAGVAGALDDLVGEFHGDVDERDETVGRRIRDAELEITVVSPRRTRIPSGSSPRRTASAGPLPRGPGGISAMWLSLISTWS